MKISTSFIVLLLLFPPPYKTVVVAQQSQTFPVEDCQGTVTQSGGDFGMDQCEYKFVAVEINPLTKEIPYKFICHLKSDVTIKIKKMVGEQESSDLIHVPKEKEMETTFKVDVDSRPEQFGELKEFLALKAENGNLETKFDEQDLPEILRAQVQGRHKAKIEGLSSSQKMYTLYFEFPKYRPPKISKEISII